MTAPTFPAPNEPMSPPPLGANQTPKSSDRKFVSYTMKAGTDAVFEAHAAPTLTSASPVPALTPRRPAHPSPPPIEVHPLCTPIRPLTLARFMSEHPDERFISTLINGFTNGFHIGYHGPRTPQQAPNLRSGSEHPMIIDDALSKEIRANRLAGPFDTIPYPNLRISGVGVVPKKDGSWRLINHLSAPEDNSINDYIDPCTYSLQYHTIDDAIRLCYKLGKDTLTCKVDIKHAFRLCPVHPSDWHLLGIQWQGRFYVDKCLPFGLRSAPFIFNMLADAIQWILEHHFAIHDSFHYLDDFFFAGAPSTSQCADALDRMLTLCTFLGIPIK